MPFPYSISVLDDFNRANNADLGANWTASGTGNSRFTVDSNQARGVAGGGSGNSDYWSASQFGPDSACYLTVNTVGGTDLLLAVRSLGSTRTQYEVYISGAGSWQIYRNIAGSGTAIGSSGSQALSDGCKVGLEAIGTNPVAVKAYFYNGSSWSVVCSNDDSNAARIQTAGYAVIYATANAGFFDDFAAGNVASVSAPVADFVGTPLSGAAPLSVAFTDLSTNSPTGWLYETSSDGGSNWTSASTQQNPTIIFT